MANYKFVDSDQLDEDLASVADRIRSKGGTTSPLAFPDGFNTAIDAISTGVTVQVITGSYSTNSSGSATVSCGFKPDAVLLYATGGSYSSYGGIAFTAFNKTSGGLLIVGPSTSYAYSNHAITQTSSGFSVSATRYNTSFKSSADSNRSIQYVAIKYTE